MDIIVLMELEKIIKANQEARKLSQIDIRDFALRNSFKWSNDFLKEVLNQYQILKKMATKLPQWHTNENVLGASLLNMEQCSSESVSTYKFKRLNGKSAVDLTGGFGVDTYHLSKKFNKVTYCETNKPLFDIVKYNFKALGVTNVNFLNISAEEFLETTNLQFDLIYLDPDRRNEDNKKLVLLHNLSPNLIDINELLLSKAQKTLVKLSPILDISQAAKQVKGLQSVEILAQKNEVKELIFAFNKIGTEADLSIQATQLGPDKIETFTFNREDEVQAKPFYSEPKKYLYEPNAAIMKAGGFKLVSVKYNLGKISRHSHYYTSENLISNFQGKGFQVNEVKPFSSKAMKGFKNDQFNILSRNFPMKPETIAQKYRLKKGGERYLIFTQNHKNEKIILSCVRTF